MVSKRRTGLPQALFGKTRSALLKLFFSTPSEPYYLRQVIRAAGTGPGAVQRELDLLLGLGVLGRKTKGRLVLYQADPDCPVFKELEGLVLGMGRMSDRRSREEPFAALAAGLKRLPWGTPY